MPRLTLSLLGTFRLAQAESPVGGFGSDKVRALLAYLAVEAGRPHRREKLSALLWSRQPEAKARASLSQSLYNLRHLLEDDCLNVTPQSIQLRPGCALEVDVAAFQSLLSGCPAHTPRCSATCPACLQNMEQAIYLYRGDFFEGLTLRGEQEFEDWAALEREKLHSKALEAMHALAVGYELRGELAAALPYARRAVALDPYDETMQRLLLHLLALNGERHTALAHYERLRDQLAQELGIEPELETQALYDQLKANGLTPLGNLPANLTPFIGRQAELVALRGMLCNSVNRLISVVGLGGCGKTRLALEAARGLQEHFTNGVYFISLAAYSPGNLIWPLLADAMRFQVQEKRDPEQQVLDYLRTKHALLIFDSFETALVKVAWLAELLQCAPRLTALVTSRACLEISNEQIFALGGMSVPELGEVERAEQFDAVQLFINSIHHRQPAFVFDDRSRMSVIRICRLVQGFPLGLLLASAWVDLYSLEEIAERIESNQDFLEVNWGDLPERQRSLRATFDYSWNLLEEGEQAVFRSLCVFRGKFTRQAAQNVSGANPQELRQVVDKSLVTPQASEWYAIHALLRQYGLEKLSVLPSDSQAVHQRYSTYYLEKLEQWEADLKGAHQAETLAAMNFQIDDLRPAWDWACQQSEIERLSRGMEGLCLYYELSTRFKEGRSACQAAADGLMGAKTPQTCSLQARLCIWQSRFSRLLGELEPARRLREDSLEIANRLAAFGMDARPVQAFVCLEAGEAIFSTDLKLAREQLQRSVELHRQINETWRLAISLAALGINLQHSGAYAEAVEPLTECIALRRASGDRRGLAFALSWLAFTIIRVGQVEKSVALVHESAAIIQSIGDKACMADELLWMGKLLIWQGQFDEAFPLLEQSLPLYHDLGDLYNLTFVYMTLGLGKMLGGNYEYVKPNLQKVMEIGPKNGFSREIALSHWILSSTALAEGGIQEALEQMQKSVNLYRQTGHQDELGWALAVLANIQTILGQPEAANTALAEALQIAATTSAHHAIKHALAATALILAREGRAIQAVELYALVREDPIWKVSPWLERVVGQYVTAASTGLAPEVIAAAQERGQQRDQLATITELLKEYTITDKSTPTLGVKGKISYQP